MTATAPATTTFQLHARLFTQWTAILAVAALAITGEVLIAAAMRRLGEAADAAGMHIRIETDPQDYDDAVVVERRR